MKKFSSLQKRTQDYINDRYGTYGIDGEDAFNSFPDKLQDLPPEKIEEFLQTKHISHFSLEEAVNILQELKPKRALLTHISHLMGLHDLVDDNLPNNINLAYDGQSLSLDL